MFIRAELIDNQGDVIAIFERDKNYKASIAGTIKKAIAWNDDGSPYETEFFANVSVKWDGCSHFWFCGEDYNDKSTDIRDAYYHICGIDSYIDFMRILVFVYEIMVKHVGYNNILEKEEYEELKKLNLLDGYTIKYYE
jgi:hypothetical protein